MISFIYNILSDLTDLSGIKLRLLTALCLSVIFPLFIISVGWFLNFLQQLQIKLLNKFFKSKTVFIICNYLTLPGVVLHELSHALMAWLTGARIHEIKFFEFGKSQLGHVIFQPTGSLKRQACQMAFASCAPVGLGFVLLYALYKALAIHVLSWPMTLLTVYMFISIFDHMTMSKIDIHNYIKGILLMFPFVFVSAWLAVYILL